MDGLEHGDPSRVDVARGRHPEAALEGRREVRHDVSEHVVGDDDLELARILDDLHAEGVDVERRRLDVGELPGNVGEGPLPEVSDEAHRVGLIRHDDLLAAARGSELEGMAEDPLDPLARGNVLLDRHLVGRPFL